MAKIPNIINNIGICEHPKTKKWDLFFITYHGTKVTVEYQDRIQPAFQYNNNAKDTIQLAFHRNYIKEYSNRMYDKAVTEVEKHNRNLLETK